MDEARLKLVRDAEEEIHRFVGESTEYLNWMPGGAPGIGLVIADAGTQVDRGVECLPLSVLETLVGMFVAAHKHAYTVWQHRDELTLLSQPASPVSH